MIEWHLTRFSRVKWGAKGKLGVKSTPFLLSQVRRNADLMMKRRYHSSRAENQIHLASQLWPPALGFLMGHLKGTGNKVSTTWHSVPERGHAGTRTTHLSSPLWKSSFLFPKATFYKDQLPRTLEPVLPPGWNSVLPFCNAPGSAPSMSLLRRNGMCLMIQFWEFWGLRKSTCQECSPFLLLVLLPLHLL